MRKSLLLVITVIFLFSPCLAGVNTDSHGDSDIWEAIVFSLKELESQKASENDTQRASSVCYDELGCFDKEGTFKHLRMLPEPPETVNTHFLLYTRKNPLEPQMLDYKKPETILKSNLDPKLPLVISTHGFGGKNNLTWLWNLKNAFLKKHDVNVIVVDWSLGARLPYYMQASVNSELVGAEIAVLYFYIKDNLGILEKDLHCVGFSLGGQVVGFVGKRMKEMRGTRPGRITGLDPASPLFEDYGGSVHLYKDDADFVDVIHTNADLLIYGGVGMGLAIGHVDFYPNGGKRQPGCGSTIGGALKDLFGNNRDHACNHERAVHLYIDSILNNDKCDYSSYKCSNYTHFESAGCMDCGNKCGHMGYHVEGEGTYYLMTKEKAPFCTEMFKLTVNFAKDIRRSYGRIIFTLVGNGGAKQNVTLTEKDGKLIPGEEKIVAIALGDNVNPITGIEVLYKKYKGWITKGTDTFVLSSVTIQNVAGNNIFKTCGPITLNDRTYQTLPTSC